MKFPDALTSACAAVALVAATVLTSVATAPAQPTAVASESSAALRAATQVLPGQQVAVSGRVPTKLARAKVTLVRRDTGGLTKVATGRTDSRGRYALRGRTPLAAGTYPYEVRVRSAGATRTVKRLSVVVAAQAPTPTEPVPTTPVPVPTPVTGPQGDPNDWTYLGGTRVARWDPCSTITWSVTGASPYATSQADIETAFARIAAATGLSFVQVADPEVSTFDITWTNATAEPRLAGTVVGLGGFKSFSQPGGPSQIVSGYVLLDQDHDLPGGFTTVGSSWGKALVHEMSHAVGLGHAAGVEQIMYPKVVLTPAEFGAGDLTGLTAVGAGQGCFATPVTGASGSAQQRTYVD